MSMSPEDLEQIGLYVRRNLGDWLAESQAGLTMLRPHDREIIEQLTRVEERLDGSIQLLKQGIEFLNRRFEQVDQRFDLMDHNNEKRFEHVDQRFKDLIHYSDRRFNSLQWTLGIGFTLLSTMMTLFKFFL